MRPELKGLDTATCVSATVGTPVSPSKAPNAGTTTVIAGNVHMKQQPIDPLVDLSTPMDLKITT
jgi:hypothetical protein